MSSTVEDVLQSINSNESKFKSIDVNKDLDVEIDEGNLLVIDTNELDLNKLRNNDDYLLEVARDNTQILFNRLWEFPIQRVQDIITIELPDGKTRLPREKPVPKPKAETKWDKYASVKGLTKRKKSRMVFDDELQQWLPRWGYNRADDTKRDWCLEVPGNADPYEDLFEKRRKARKENLAKNELQRLRNIARSSKGKVPGVGITPTENPDQNHLAHAITAAKVSDASVGRFSKVVRNEKPQKNLGKKRKFESNESNMSGEKMRQMKILKSIEGTPIVKSQRQSKSSIRAEIQAKDDKRQAKRTQKRQLKKGKDDHGKKKLNHKKK